MTGINQYSQSKDCLINCNFLSLSEYLLLIATEKFSLILFNFVHSYLTCDCKYFYICIIPGFPSFKWYANVFSQGVGFCLYSVIASLLGKKISCQSLLGKLLLITTDAAPYPRPLISP